MLNPSTADATLDDPTIRRCRRFARDWGMGALVVVNLYALRSVDPRALETAEDPVGPENDDVTHDAIARSRTVIVAWGADRHAQARSARILEILAEVGRRPYCLGLTKENKPRHPLYVRADLRPIPFTGAR
jgi:hypothetical protein